LIPRSGIEEEDEVRVANVDARVAVAGKNSVG